MMPTGNKRKEYGGTPETKIEYNLGPWVSGWFCFFACIPDSVLQPLLYMQWNLKVALGIRTAVHRKHLGVS